MVAVSRATRVARLFRTMHAECGDGTLSAPVFYHTARIGIGVRAACGVQ